MSAETKKKATRPGDLLIISRHQLGEAEQTAQVLDVLGRDDHPHYRVRWDDGHESIFFPGSDAMVVPTKRDTR